MMNDTIVEAPSIEEIEDELLETEGYEEAKLIPLDKVSSRERYILTKYLNKENLTEEEHAEVKEVLQRFRPSLYKYDPDGAVETVQKNEEIILDEKAFLEMEDNFNEVVTIPFGYPAGNTWRRMHFDVYPITDSQAVLDIQNNLSMFKDLTAEEAAVYNKMQGEERLSREEEIIKASVERKIQDATQNNTKDIIVEFLAMQLKFKGRDSSYEDMKRVFERIPLLYLAVLFKRVQDINALGDIDTERVFREFSD